MSRWLRINLPVLTIAGAFLWSVVAIVSHRAKEAPPGTKITLRIAHWQLETGVREGLNRFAAAYQKLHPEVYIVQDAIPETTYGQWLTTQLMGGTASDIIEIGKLAQPILVQYQQRYFVPITMAVNDPNPYNAGTALAGLPWRQTYRDGMRSGYVEEMQEYVGVPLSQFGVRIFYNRTLLERLTGRTAAPRNYREFLAACEDIRRHRTAKGEPLVPIAGSGYHVAMWNESLCDPITYPALRRLDFNRDGLTGSDETFVAFKTGRLDFQFPAYRAKFEMLRQLTAYFQRGYTGLTRDDAVLLFAQQRAVFLTTGTWDAYSLREQAAGKFEVGVMDFPIPTKDDPEFGAIVEGPRYESQNVGFKFGITRTCRHPEAALDFLMFLSAQRNNEELNRHIGWIPCIVDTAVNPLLQAFEPHLEGVQTAFNVTMGGETYIKWMQLYSSFQVRQIDYNGLVREFAPFYQTRGQLDFDELQRNRIRGMQRNEQFLAGYRARALYATGKEARSLWIKYRSLTQGRLVGQEQMAGLLERLLRDGPVTNAVGPYEYRPAVLEQARQTYLARARP